MRVKSHFSSDLKFIQHNQQTASKPTVFKLRSSIAAKAWNFEGKCKCKHKSIAKVLANQVLIMDSLQTNWNIFQAWRQQATTQGNYHHPLLLAYLSQMNILDMGQRNCSNQSKFVFLILSRNQSHTKWRNNLVGSISGSISNMKVYSKVKQITQR